MITYPIFLIPAAMLAWWYFKKRHRRSVWRDAMVIVLVIAAGFPQVLRRSSEQHLLLVADRSKSMDAEAWREQNELIDLVQDRLQPGDRLSIVSFGQTAHLEAVLRSADEFGGFSTPYSPDSSDLEAGINLAMNLANDSAAAKMLLLSDGEFTGQDPLLAAARAADRQIPIFHRHLKRTSLFDIAVVDARGPTKTVVQESFALAFDISATEQTPAAYRVLRNDRVLEHLGDDNGWKQIDLPRGVSTITLADLVSVGGVYQYAIEVRVSGGAQENLLENNRGELFINVLGEDRVLVVNQSGQPDNVTRVMEAAGIPYAITSIKNYRFALVYLAGYKAVVLNNVQIAGLTYQQILDLKNFVSQEGGGLIVTGGNKSYAGGGYRKTPLEEVLPVSMEVQQKMKKVATAMSFVLDRSGSMMASVGAGRTKMDLANEGTVAGIDLLSDFDSVSVIAVDSLAHVILKQQNLVAKEAIQSQVLRIQSMGGGIFVYTGLVAAGEQLVTADQNNKHIVLFSDAADSEEPGDYRNLIHDYRDAGITISVIGLGTERDPDARFLRDVAERGGGNIYFADDPRSLPQLFTLDTINMTRQPFVSDEAANWQIRLASNVITKANAWQDFAATDYNLIYPRAEADTAILSTGEDAVPGLAFWQYGVGRCVAWAFDLNGDAARVPFMSEALLDSIRWAMGAEVADNFQLRTRRIGSNATVQVELSDSEVERFEQAVLKLYAPDGTEEERPMRWIDRNTLEVDFGLVQSGAYRGMVDLGTTLIKMEPVGLPSSPEFLRDVPPDFGERTLETLSEVSGGNELLDVGELFVETEGGQERQPLFPLLMTLVLILLVLDVAEQRFAQSVWLRGKAVAMAKRVGAMASADSSSTPRKTATPERSAVGAQSAEQSGGSLPGNDKTKRAAKPAQKSAKAPAEKKPAETAKPKKEDQGFGYLREAKLKGRNQLKNRKK